MAATLASTSNTVNNSRQNTQMGFLPVSRGSTTYVRPADWTALPTVNVGDEKFVGLMAVTNDSTNYVSIQLIGDVSFRGTIDWGDGTSDTGILNNAVVTHVYNYATLSSSVSSRGYKMAIVTITVTAGSWTGFNICTATPATIAGNNTTATYKWLDVAFAGANIVTIGLSGSTVQNQSTMLEQANIVQINTLPTPATNLFGTTATALQNCIFGTVTNRATNVTSLFQGCISLVNAPDITNLVSTTPGTVTCTSLFQGCTALVSISNFTIKPVTTSSMFSGCSSLVTAINLDLSSCINPSNMFLNCVSLTTIQSTYVIGGGNLDSMFSGCSSLRTAPAITYTGVSGFTIGGMFLNCISLISVPGYSFPTISTPNNSIFQGCTALVQVGYLNFSSSANGSYSSMFSGCNALEKIAGINFGPTGPSTVASMFQNCTVLREFPLFNTGSCTDFSSMFNGCTQLTTIPAYNTGQGLTFNSMFTNCTSLVTGPTLDLTRATSTASMFNGCRNLVSIPTYNTSNVSLTTTMFNACTSLVTIPALNTINATTLASVFSGCQALITVPTFNTSNCTNFSGMFQNCDSLAVAPPIDTSKATIVTAMFTSCTSLNSIPAYNFANVTTVFNTGFTALTAVGNISMTGTKVSHIISNDKIGKTELENYFTLIGTNTAVQTLTMTTNPGADTANAKTSGTTAGSNVVTMANTVGIVAGTTRLYGTGVNTGIPVTFTAAGSTVVYTNGGGVNGLANGDNVMFTAITTTTGIVINTPYFVVSRTGTTFQVSATSGGTALTLTGNGTGVMSIGGATISNRVVTVNANANVIISGVSGITNAAASLTARNLNTNYAVTKNWTVTG